MQKIAGGNSENRNTEYTWTKEAWMHVQYINEKTQFDGIGGQATTLGEQCKECNQSSACETTPQTKLGITMFPRLPTSCSDTQMMPEETILMLWSSSSLQNCSWTLYKPDTAWMRSRPARSTITIHLSSPVMVTEAGTSMEVTHNIIPPRTIITHKLMIGELCRCRWETAKATKGNVADPINCWMSNMRLYPLLSCSPDHRLPSPRRTAVQRCPKSPDFSQFPSAPSLAYCVSGNTFKEYGPHCYRIRDHQHARKTVESLTFAGIFQYFPSAWKWSKRCECNLDIFPV